LWVKGPWKKPLRGKVSNAGLSHSAWKSRKASGISTFTTAATTADELSNFSRQKE
jgi:hypothetical protein